MKQYYVQYHAESEGGWQHLNGRSSLSNAIERAMMYEKAGENGPSDYSETKVFALDTDTNVVELVRHVVVKRKPVVQYNKRGEAVKKSVATKIAAHHDWQAMNPSWADVVYQPIPGAPNAG